MAVIRDALRFVPGSSRLVLLRWLLAGAAALPAFLAVHTADSDAARTPYFTDPAGTLPAVQAAELVGAIGPSAAAGIGIVALLALLLGQVLTGGALAVFDPRRPRAAGKGVVRQAWRAGLARFWALLRVVAWTALILACGAGIVRGIATLLTRAGERGEWTGATLSLTLPLSAAGATVAWAAIAAAWGFWAKVITVSDRREQTRRTMLLAARVILRRPFATAGFFVVVSSAAVAVPALVLWGWRRSPPAGVAGAWGWFALALAAQAFPAFAWHWTVRAGRLVYAGPEFDDLRARPDAPFRWVSSAYRWLVRKGRRSAPAPPP